MYPQFFMNLKGIKSLIFLVGTFKNNIIKVRKFVIVRQVENFVKNGVWGEKWIKILFLGQKSQTTAFLYLKQYELYSYALIFSSNNVSKVKYDVFGSVFVVVVIEFFFIVAHSRVETLVHPIAAVYHYQIPM